MRGTLCVPVTDQEPGNRTLMPAFDLSQHCFQIVGDRLEPLAGVLNLISFTVIL